jgi:hypothetical protein
MTVTSITQAERDLYERLTVFQEDLNQAAYFANYLLKKGWHFDPWDRRIRWPTYMQQAAFTTALVTAYCRPFVQSRSAPTLSMRLAPYCESELQLHEKLQTLRNTIYAHSDVDLHKVRPVSINDRATAIVSLPILKLTRDETQLVLSMIRKTSQAIAEKLQSLIARVEMSA